MLDSSVLVKTRLGTGLHFDFDFDFDFGMIFFLSC